MYEMQIIPKDNEIVVRFSGEIGYGEITQIEDRLNSALGMRPRRITLDCADLAFADSSFLRMLLQLEKRAKSSAATLRLKNVPRAVSKIFTCTGLDTHFNWSLKASDDAKGASGRAGTVALPLV